MYEISLSKRREVVRMFLQGVSFDAIARQLGIGKGSVANIIEEFREGDLAVPSDMNEYVNALRKIAVDLGKHNTSISHVMIYARLHAKLVDTGADIDKVEQWIDTCQEMASNGVSGNELLSAAMELVQMKSETGLGYKDIVNDYKAKRNARDELREEIKKENAMLAQVKSEHKKEKEQTARELESITRAMTTSQELFHKQKYRLKSELDAYLAQNRLSWEKVNLALALFDSKFGKSDTPKRVRDQLTKRILRTKSLVKVNKRLEKEKVILQSEIVVSVQEEQRANKSLDELKELDERFQESITVNIPKAEKLIAEIGSRMAELQVLKQSIIQHTHDLYISRLIIDFLSTPNNLSKYDLDRFVSLMISLRQKRLGIEPRRITDDNGEVTCECLRPTLYRNIIVPDSEIDGIRETFAHLLAPLVKDKLISRYDYEIEKIKQETSKYRAVTEAILKERSKHIF